jgi:hypothetical protein
MIYIGLKTALKTFDHGIIFPLKDAFPRVSGWISHVHGALSDITGMPF